MSFGMCCVVSEIPRGSWSICYSATTGTPQKGQIDVFPHKLRYLSLKYGMSLTNDILITSPFEKVNLQVLEKIKVFKALAFWFLIWDCICIMWPLRARWGRMSESILCQLFSYWASAYQMHANKTVCCGVRECRRRLYCGHKLATSHHLKTARSAKTLSIFVMCHVHSLQLKTRDSRSAARIFHPIQDCGFIFTRASGT